VIGSGLTASEHLHRMFRVRIYVLVMLVRMLMLLQLLAVLALISNYCSLLPFFKTRWRVWTAEIPCMEGRLRLSSSSFPS
jgi:hypothetical protein